MRPARVVLSLFSVFGLIGIAAIGVTGCAGLGKPPSAEQRRAFEASPNFDPATGTFVNLPEPELDSFWTANRERFRDGFDASFNGAGPDFRLPQVTTDFDAFTAGTAGLKAVWIGHSSVLLRIDTTTVLFDPVFGRSSPLSFFAGPRFQPPPFARSELPDVDFIVISHEHYDHLERATIEHFADTETRFVVPLGMSSHLRHWGARKDRVIELDWWDSVTLNGVEFVATPAWHSSGRRKRDENRTQWASWVVRSANHTVYFSGDTGYGRHFRSIGDRFGPFDIVFLETGQYSRAWRSHLKPEHWPVVMRELKSVNWFPIHWGVFSFAPHDWDEPIRAADSIAPEHRLTLFTPRQGEVVDLRNPPEFTRWWIREDGAE